MIPMILRLRRRRSWLPLAGLVFLCSPWVSFIVLLSTVHSLHACNKCSRFKAAVELQTHIFGFAIAWTGQLMSWQIHRGIHFAFNSNHHHWRRRRWCWRRHRAKCSPLNIFALALIVNWYGNKEGRHVQWTAPKWMRMVAIFHWHDSEWFLPMLEYVHACRGDTRKRVWGRADGWSVEQQER